MEGFFKKLSRHTQSQLNPDYLPLAKPGHWRYMGYINQYMRSKYMPHQGAKECERRRRQMRTGEYAK